MRIASGEMLNGGHPRVGFEVIQCTDANRENLPSSLISIRELASVNLALVMNAVCSSIRSGVL